MPVSLPGHLMVSVSGFRGKVGSCLTPELISSLAAAFGAFLEGEDSPGPVYLARDSRSSGEMFSDAARAGPGERRLGRGRSRGCPHAYGPSWLPKTQGAAGALVVTASQQPCRVECAQIRGLRMGLFSTWTGWRDSSASFGRRSCSAPGGIGSVRYEGTRRPFSATSAGSSSLPLLEVDRIRERGFRVALDCVRGAGGLMVPRLLEALGCTVSGMDLEPDGRFPRDPEPTAVNLGGLGSLVRESGSELGFAVDPDVDRLALVDGEGGAPRRDLTLALCTAAVLQRRKGPVVMNLSTSRVVEDVVRECGGRLIRAPVGEVNVSRRMSRRARSSVGRETEV